MKIQIRCGERLIAENVLIADTLKTRVLGLMFSKSIPGGDGLLLDPCNSIHTFFMRYALDVVFIGPQNQIVKIIRNIEPWRMTWIYFKARKTLEMQAGKFPSEIKEGDILEMKNV
jgi:uncharacterized protein